MSTKQTLFTSAISLAFTVLLAACTNQPTAPSSHSKTAQSLTSAQPPQTRPNAKPKPAYVVELENHLAQKQAKASQRNQHKAWLHSQRQLRNTRREQIAAQLKQRADLLGQKLRDSQRQKSAKNTP